MFEWKSSYSCDIKKIDDQHKILFQLGEKLFYIVSTKDGYEHYKSHKVEHDAFINKIASVAKRDNIDDTQKKISMELLMFIADWIEKHILKSDMMYKELFHKNGFE